MLRVHFTTADLANLRVATDPDPLWEIANSLQLLQKREGALVFDDWRGRVRLRMPQAARLLVPLLPPYGYFPDFLTPPSSGEIGLEAAVDAVLRTPRRMLRTDLTTLANERALPPWVRGLADGETETLHRLGASLQFYYDTMLAPSWSSIQAHVDADRALRARSFLDGGVERLLAELAPVFRWQPPVLEADYPVERELYLDGRGLLLQPSFFCWRRPVTFASSNYRPVVVYPIQHTVGWARRRGTDGPAPSSRQEALGALIGQTRSVLLDAVCTGASTGELARRVGVSPPAISQHMAVSREAGLVVSIRRANRVMHTITPEGRTLLLAPRS